MIDSFAAIGKAWSALREFVGATVEQRDNVEARMVTAVKDVSVKEGAVHDASRVLDEYQARLKVLTDRRDFLSAKLSVAVAADIPAIQSELANVSNAAATLALQVEAAQRVYDTARAERLAEWQTESTKQLEAENVAALASYDEALARVREAQSTFEDAILVLAALQAKLDNQLRSASNMPGARLSGRGDFDFAFTPMTMPTKMGQSPTYRWVAPPEFRQRVQRALGK